jgi:hypothetical protein
VSMPVPFREAEVEAFSQADANASRVHHLLAVHLRPDHPHNLDNYDKTTPSVELRGKINGSRRSEMG